MKHVLKLLLVTFGSIALLGAACGDPGSGDQTTPGVGAADLPYNKADFLTAVAAVPDRDFAIYWIGDEPKVGDVQLTGPQFVPLSSQNEPDAIEYKYTQQIGSSLQFAAYTPAAWQELEDLIIPAAPSVVHPIAVAGGEGLLYETDGSGNYTHLFALITFPDTVLRVETHTTYDGSSKTPLVNPPDLNPLTDVDLFVSILEQQLRPYPD